MQIKIKQSSPNPSKQNSHASDTKQQKATQSNAQQRKTKHKQCNATQRETKQRSVTMSKAKQSSTTQRKDPNNKAAQNKTHKYESTGITYIVGAALVSFLCFCVSWLRCRRFRHIGYARDQFSVSQRWCGSSNSSRAAVAATPVSPPATTTFSCAFNAKCSSLVRIGIL